MSKKDYIWNPGTCIFETSRYFRTIADDSKTVCDESISVKNSRKVVNTA